MKVLDLSFLESSTLILAEHDQVQLLLAGCGGTGSHVAKSIAQVAAAAIEKGKRVKVTFVDPDLVEPKNVPRQHFCHAEIGIPKSLALARRYSAAWGIEIEAVQKPFNTTFLDKKHDSLKIIIGAVDNPAARKTIHNALKAAFRRKDEPPLLWWLDSGNDYQSGQVLLGSTHSTSHLKSAFRITGMCTDVPLPSLQAPELIATNKTNKDERQLSCAELLNLNLQALSVNTRVAAEVGDFLMRMLITNDLRKMATYFDLPSGNSRSTYLKPKSVKHYVQR
jgi:PRTRC genetic system ThiF family protein